MRPISPNQQTRMCGAQVMRRKTVDMGSCRRSAAASNTKLVDSEMAPLSPTCAQKGEMNNETQPKAANAGSRLI
jgi:hypothetical protein